MNTKPLKQAALFVAMLLFCLNSFSQEFNAYSETGDIVKLDKNERLKRVLGTNGDNFYVLRADMTTFRIYAYNKTTLKEVWVHEIKWPKFNFSEPDVEVLKQGVLIYYTDHKLRKDGITINATLLNPVTGVPKQINSDFLLKKEDDRFVKFNLMSQDSTKLYWFTAKGNLNKETDVKVHCVQISDMKELWSRAFNFGGQFFNIKIDNDNMYFMVVERGEKEKAYHTYLGKYDFQKEKLEAAEIADIGSKTINAKLYATRHDMTGSEVGIVSKFNAAKMELIGKDQIVVAGFCEEAGKPGYFMKTFSRDGLKPVTEATGSFPKDIEDRLAKHDFKKTTFYAQEVIREGSAYQLIGQQINPGSGSTKQYDYVIVSFDESLKGTASLLPPQQESFAETGAYPLNCFSYDKKVWISYLKFDKSIEEFAGTSIFEKYKPAVQSTEGKKKKNFFIRMGEQGVEQVKVLEVDRNKGKSASIDDLIGSSNTMNYELPYLVIPNGDRIIITYTNFVWPNGVGSKYCFGSVKMK